MERVLLSNNEKMRYFESKVKSLMDQIESLSSGENMKKLITDNARQLRATLTAAKEAEWRGCTT